MFPRCLDAYVDGRLFLKDFVLMFYDDLDSNYCINFRSDYCHSTGIWKRNGKPRRIIANFSWPEIGKSWSPISLLDFSQISEESLTCYWKKCFPRFLSSTSPGLSCFLMLIVHSLLVLIDIPTNPFPGSIYKANHIISHRFSLPPW